MDGEERNYLRGSLSESVLEFFRDYGVECTTCEADMVSIAPPSDGEFHVGSIVGFSGKSLRGGLAFVAPAALVARMLPVPHDERRAERQLRDWSGEMANQLAGRFKNKLSSRKLHFDVGTAACFRGKSMQLSFLSAADAMSFTFTIASAGIHVYLDCCIVGGGSRAESEPAPIVPEGSVVLF